MNVAELPAGVEIDTLCALPLTVTEIVPSTLYSSLKKLSDAFKRVAGFYPAELNERPSLDVVRG